MHHAEASSRAFKEANDHLRPLSTKAQKGVCGMRSYMVRQAANATGKGSEDKRSHLHPPPHLAGVEDDCVDAAQLLEQRQPSSQNHHSAVARLQQSAPTQLRASATGTPLAATLRGPKLGQYRSNFALGKVGRWSCPPHTCC